MQSKIIIYKNALGAITLFLLVQAVLATKAGVLSGKLHGTDTYMWLNRVQQLYETGSWYDHALLRINPPLGYEQHWTRPFDVILLVGAWLGSSVTDFANALFVWSAAISPILGICSLLVLFWAVRPIFRENGYDVLGILFISQIGLVTTFVIGRGDHQSLIMLLFIASLGFGVRLLANPFDRRMCFVAGLIAALSIWVSVEAILFSVVTFAGLGTYWLIGERSIGRKLLNYSVTLFLLLILFRAVEYGWLRFLEPAHDQISIVYIALFGLLAAFWGIVNLLHSQSKLANRLPGRVGIALSGALVTGLTMSLLFPGFFAGPMGDMDELFRRAYLVNIRELQPVFDWRDLSTDSWPQSLANLFLWLGIIVPGIPVLIYLVRNSDGTRRKGWAYILICTLVYLPLGLKEIRWVPYLAFLMIPGYAWLILQLMQAISNRFVGGAASLLRIAALAIGATVFLLPATIFGRDSSESVSNDCPLISIAGYLDQSTHSGEASRRLLAFTDFGPELLYRTRHSVFSIPSHRYHSGFTDSYNVMSALEDTEALRIITERSVDLILICPGGLEENFYVQEADGEVFYERISRGSVPDWLIEVTLPAEIANAFRLFSVTLLPPENANHRGQ